MARTSLTAAKRVVALFAVLCTVVAGCTSEAETRNAAWDRQLSDVVSKGIEQASIPGAIVGIWQYGQPPFVRAFGTRDTATREPMATDLYMRIGSVTKTFTTTAILQLVEQGKVGLDDPISKYVPGVPNGENITIRQLGAMRSGLYSYSNEVIPMLPSDPQRQWTPKELLDISFSHPPLFPPGAEFDYSNTNTVLLGLVVESASGQSYGEYLEEHLITPAALAKTMLPTGSEFPSPHSHGYIQGPGDTVLDTTDWNASWGWAAGAMISTLDDMRTWAEALARGKFVSPAMQREREKFQLAPSEGDGSTYGFGLENQNGWLGHNGNASGYLTYAYYLPDQPTTMVVMANSSLDLVGLWNLVGDIVSVVTPDHPWPGPPKET